MVLYIHRGKNHKGKDGEFLVQKALNDYTQGKYKTAVIKRDEKGKPFFVGIPVHFSVSHTGEIWMCLMGDTQVGLDIQILKKLDYGAISKRFFSVEEAEYVDKKGENAFFKLWVMKEAYVKYTGTGFSGSGFAEPTLIMNGTLVEYLIKDQKKVHFKEIKQHLTSLQLEIETELYGFLCSEQKEENILCREI